MTLRTSAVALMLALVPSMALAGEFDGAYVGLNMGYAMRALERHIPVPSNGSTATLGDLSSNGLQTGPVLGYGATSGRLYFGGEIDAARSWQDNAKVHTEGINGTAHFRNSAAASGLLGLLFDDDVLLYGRVGYEYLDEKDEFANQPMTITRSRGFAVGGGMEFKLIDHLHLRGEFTYANLDGLRTEVARARLSLLYRFHLF